MPAALVKIPKTRRFKMRKEYCIGEKFFHFAHAILENREEIGLSEEDARRIRDLKIKTKKEIIKSTADMEIIGVDIFSKLMEEKVDLTEMDKLIDKKFDLKKEGAKKLILAFVTIKGMLKKEQLKKLKNICKGDKTHEETQASCCR